MHSVLLKCLKQIATVIKYISLFKANHLHLPKILSKCFVQGQGLFKNITEGMRQSRMLVAFVSDEVSSYSAGKSTVFLSSVLFPGSNICF